MGGVGIAASGKLMAAIPNVRYEIDSPYTPLLDKDMTHDENELVPTCPPNDPFSPQGRELVTMEGIASLLKQQLGPLTAHINRLSANVETLDAKYGNMKLKMAMEQRLDKMESKVGGRHHGAD